MYLNDKFHRKKFFTGKKKSNNVCHAAVTQEVSGIALETAAVLTLSRKMLPNCPDAKNSNVTLSCNSIGSFRVIYAEVQSEGSKGIQKPWTGGAVFREPLVAANTVNLIDALHWLNTFSCNFWFPSTTTPLLSV